MRRSEEALASGGFPVLHHYTSGEGLIGIVENAELWATHILFLNDSAEYRYAADVALHMLGEVDVLRVLGERVPDLRECVIAAFNNHLSSDMRSRVFVCSFSEQEDDLSQWRGYTRPGDGYAIGFGRRTLAAAADASGWALMPVGYGYGGVKDLLLPNLVQLFIDYSATVASGAGRPDALQQASDSAASLLSGIAARIKDEAFVAEREWRLVGEFPLVDTRYSIRNGASSLIPFARFEFDRGLIETVMVGPGPNPHMARRGVTSLLAANELNGVRARNSHAPYRAW